MSLQAPHSVDEMARAGCTSPRGIRFWEEKGLLGDVARSEGGTRRYTSDQLDIARIIAAASFGGFPLDAIGAMLKEFDQEAYDAIAWRLEAQTRAAIKLAQELPSPPLGKRNLEFDL